MTHKSIKYKQVIYDYFKDFKRDYYTGKSLAVCLVYLSIPFLHTCVYGLTKGIDQLNKNRLVGIPVLIALISSSFHRTSLPFMMYLVPYSKKQREEFIQKKLVVKIAFPVIFGCLFDIAAVCFGSVSYYAVILQMTGILFITYICGILGDGSPLFPRAMSQVPCLHEHLANAARVKYPVACSGVFDSQIMPVYGEIRIWAGILPLLCYMGSTALFEVCAEPVSRTEFWVVLGIMLLILLPITAAVHKRWETIRSNFADYEMTIKRTDVR